MRAVDALLSSGHSLEKLCLTGYHIYSEFANSISNQHGQSLKVLNLKRTVWEDFESFKLIFKKCVQLKELNLNIYVVNSYVLSNEEVLTFLVKNLTTSIEKLSIPHNYLKDEQIHTLVRRCKNLKSLHLINNAIGNSDS